MINTISFCICLIAVVILFNAYNKRRNNRFFLILYYISIFISIYNWKKKYSVFAYQIRIVKDGGIYIHKKCNSPTRKDESSCRSKSKNRKQVENFKRINMMKDVDDLRNKHNGSSKNGTASRGAKKQKVNIENENQENNEPNEKNEKKEQNEESENGEEKTKKGTKRRNEKGRERMKKRNSYYNALCTNQYLNKCINENVNFEDGVSNFFIMNPSPKIDFFVEKNTFKGNRKKYKKEIGIDTFKEERTVKEEKIEKTGRNEKEETKKRAMFSGNSNDQKQKVFLKLERGYMNEVYEREKQKLSEILFSQKDESIFQKKTQPMKKNILLLNGQVVKVDIIKQYVFNKLRLEYYERIRDQKKILTLDLWAKEINISVDNLKELILYIYKMKNLVQKEDEDMLRKTYFYNKNNMFTLFRSDKMESPNSVSQQTEWNVSNVVEYYDKENDNRNMKKRKQKKETKTTKRCKLFDDNFENVETFLHSDCEELINTQIAKCIECIKDIVFFENSIYIIEKLENRPPLLEELAFAYNIEKEKFINGLEKKIKLSEKLLMYFMPLIRNVIKKAETNFSSNLSEDDFLLISLDAVKNGFKKYDLQKGGITNLTKHVYMWVKNSTYSYYQKHKSFVPLSTSTYKDYNKIKKFEEEFYQKHNKKPNLKDISEGLNMKEEKVQKILSSSYNIIEAEKPLTYKNDTSSSSSFNPNPEKNTYKDLIVNSDDIHSFNEIVYNEIVIKGLRKFICKSIKSKKNKILIFMKFGLFLHKKIYSDSEICDVLKISKAKFQKLFQNAMNEIKKYLKKCKKDKEHWDAASVDFSSYFNFAQFDFFGNEFSQLSS